MVESWVATNVDNEVNYIMSNKKSNDDSEPTLKVKYDTKLEKFRFDASWNEKSSSVHLMFGPRLADKVEFITFS